MSYIKLGQIADLINGTPNIVGSIYIEDENGIVIQSNNPIFPLQVTMEVISWVSQEEQQKHGKIEAFNTETIIISDQSTPIRQSVFNQLVDKYSLLII